MRIQYSATIPHTRKHVITDTHYNLGGRKAFINMTSEMPSSDHHKDTEDMLKIKPGRQAELLEAAASVTRRITTAQTAANRSQAVRLILVSKLKPASDILSLHQKHPDEYQHFGENYVQELTTKAQQLPKTIKWHFIGGLQSNKAKSLAADVDSLWCVSSVDSVKKANELEKGRQRWAERQKEARNTTAEAFSGDDTRLRVHVQVNTSGEESKSGVEPSETLTLCKHIVDSCPHLQLTGVMTIGAIARSQETTPETENEDFVALRNVRDDLVKQLSWKEEDIELSMGMSNDFESAIKCGADEVRVGSTIFGERAAKGSRIPEDKKEGG